MNWHRLFVSLLAALLLTGAVSHALAQVRELRVGVLAFRDLEQTRRQWQPTVDQLNRKVSGAHFSLDAMFYDDFLQAMKKQRFDFVLVNPEFYLARRLDQRLSAIATLMPLAEGHPVSQFGGVIFTRADRADIDELQDLRGKTVAAPFAESFGGFLMQRWELYQTGIDIGELAGTLYTGMPHDKVVQEVLAGSADAGFVRSGILESMAREGKLDLARIKLLNPQPAGIFPQRVSTDLYPEWPFVSTARVSEAVVKKVTLALLQIHPDEQVAVQGNYYAFAPAGNYAAAEAIMQRLQYLDQPNREFRLRDVARQYALELIAAALLILLLVIAVLVHLRRVNRNLLLLQHRRERMSRVLARSNERLERKVEVRTRELQQSENRFRSMFEHHASPMLLIEPTEGAIVNANHAAAAFYGYPEARLRSMNIAEINMMSPQEISAERSKAMHEERNYFVFPHRLADGGVRTVEVHSSPVVMAGRTLLFSIVHDITERQELESRLQDMAFYDPLTHLANRRLMLDRLRQALLANVRSGQCGALIFLDLDNFKKLNDLHGHAKGDQLLCEVARRILSSIRQQDTAARLGGDEFLVMLETLSDSLETAVIQAEMVAEKIRSALAEPYLLTGDGGEVIEHHCSSSIGVTVFCDRQQDIDILLKRADMAMYEAKQAGRDTIRFFDPAMQAAIEQRAGLENELRSAVESGQLRLFYQVQVDAGRKVQGAEVLLRWQHPRRGLVAPGEFITLAEETGMILPIGQWVLETACAQIKAWQPHPVLRDLTLSVNVSARQFAQTDFVEKVMLAVRHHAINPLLLKLELTESVVLEDIEESICKMRALKDFGVRFAMDDFGTGYSSLTYLKRLPLDQLKIDQSFVRQISNDQADRVMVMAIVDLAMNFELDIIAEGVETEAQFQLLHRFGCGSFQGYLFSKPVPLAEFEALLPQGTALEPGV